VEYTKNVLTDQIQYKVYDYMTSGKKCKIPMMAQMRKWILSEKRYFNEQGQKVSFA